MNHFTVNQSTGSILARACPLAEKQETDKIGLGF